MDIMLKHLIAAFLVDSLYAIAVVRNQTILLKIYLQKLLFAQS